MINTDGDVLSVRIDRPAGSQPAGPGGSRQRQQQRQQCRCHRGPDAVGCSHIAQWVAADQESGLTLLRIFAPHLFGRSKGRVRATWLGSPVVVIGNRSAWAIRSAGDTSLGLTALLKLQVATA